MRGATSRQEQEEQKQAQIDHNRLYESDLEEGPAVGEREKGKRKGTTENAQVKSPKEVKEEDRYIPKEQWKIAIKQLRKNQLKGIKTGVPFLINEIKVHWALEDCDTVLKLL
jgi:hypothetical protein